MAEYVEGGKYYVHLVIDVGILVDIEAEERIAKSTVSVFAPDKLT